MNDSIKVTYAGKEYEFKKGITLYEIAHRFRGDFYYSILSAKMDNEICDLSRTVERKCKVEFYDRSSIQGNTVYSSSVQFLMIVAVKKAFPDYKIIIENSIDKGLYCSVENGLITKTDLKLIEDVMNQIVSEDFLYNKVSVSRMDAIAYFKRKKNIDKVNVLKYISNTFISLYKLDDIYDYFFTRMAYSTKDIDSFKLTYISENGFVLSYPSVYNPDITEEYHHKPLVADTFKDYTKWGKMVGISVAADLNKIVSEGKYVDTIRLAETYFDSQLCSIADKISEKRDQVKIILISGPSSSGKTTSAKKLSVYLESRGLKPHLLSTDDYFFNRENSPKDENGDYDFECLQALDLNLFNKHLSKLLSGEKVLIPEFNFVTGKREYKKRYLELKENDLIIIEGLHCLNEDLTASVDRKNKFKIFLAPFTQLNIDEHNRIHTSDTRRLRRIIRDNRSRGYSAADTLKMWKKIREGEQNYIFPYQDEADIILNSSLIYELGILKTYAEPLLYAVSETDEMYPEAIRLINFLRNFLPIPSDDVPKDSILREFIGGSEFDK